MGPDTEERKIHISILKAIQKGTGTYEEVSKLTGISIFKLPKYFATLQILGLIRARGAKRVWES